MTNQLVRSSRSTRSGRSPLVGGSETDARDVCRPVSVKNQTSGRRATGVFGSRRHVLFALKSKKAMEQAPGRVALHRKFVDKLDITLVATCEARDELGVAPGTEQRSHPLKHRQ